MDHEESRLDPRKDVAWLRELDAMLCRQGVLDSLRRAVHFAQLKSVVVVSDYGGEHRGSKYFTYSFLFAAMEAIRAWHDRIMELKLQRFPDQRTIEYKKLRDVIRQKALPEWLRLAGLMPGCIVTIAVQKEVDYLFLPSEGDIRQVLEGAGFNGYSLPVARKLILIIHFLCYFSSYIYGPENRVFWHTDRDSISGSGSQHLLVQLGSLLAQVAPLYFDKRPEHFGYSDGLNDPERLFEDALSLPDLVAGVLADKFTPGREDYAHRNGREDILRWVADETMNLQHLIVRFDSHIPAADGTLQFVPKLVKLELTRR